MRVLTRATLSLLPSLAICAALAYMPAARAEKADSKKEMVIEAEHLISDGKTNTNIFTGDVLITRGTLTVHAERAVALKSADDFQHVNLTGKAGAKVSFRQKRDGDWKSVFEEIEAAARTLAV